MTLPLAIWSFEEEDNQQVFFLLRAAARPAMPVEGLVKATRLAGLFSDPCRLTVASAQHAGSCCCMQIQDRIVLVGTMYTQVQVSLHDIAIDLSRKTTAVVGGTIRLCGQGRGETVADVQELQAEMGKTDGQWLFTAVEIVEVLER